MAAELFGVGADRGNQLTVKSTDRAGDTVQDIALQHLPCRVSQIGSAGINHEPGEPIGGISHDVRVWKTVALPSFPFFAYSIRRCMSSDMSGISERSNQRASRLSSSAGNGSPATQSIRNT